MKKRKNSNFTFNSVPTIRRSRTCFPVSYSTKTTLNIGTLQPVDWQEVYPGDTFSFSDTFVNRTTSAYLRPVMDNAFVDVHYFFVPYRLLYDDFTKVITGSQGDGEPDDWTDEYQGAVPSIPKGTIIPRGTVGDALGLPTGIPLGRPVSVLPFRAVAKVYNDWFRNENVTKSTYMHRGEFNEQELPNSNEWSVSNYCGKLPKVTKFKDYFTSALPKPQKGDAVSLGLAQFADDLPVVAKADPHGQSQASIQFTAQGGIYDTYAAWLSKGEGTLNHYLEARTSTGADGDIATVPLLPQNLFALTSNQDILSADVNDLRLAFALQKIKERSARSGSRFTEYILAAFGVQSPDASLQRSELLAGKRIPLGYTQVAQTSSSTGNDNELASVAAYGLSDGRCGFKKAFTEPGIVLTFMSIRYRHTYQQGIAPKWTRLERFDFYDPTFQSIGEQPIYATEIYGKADEERVFGYKGAWDELRVFPSTVTMQMRSATPEEVAQQGAVSQDIYHYGDFYSSVPVLGEEFINETPTFMGRALSVSPDAQDPFIFDIYRQGTAIRVLPSYSIPSLIDHH